MIDIKDAKRNKKIGMAVIDYVTLMRPKSKGFTDKSDYNDMIFYTRQLCISENFFFMSPAQSNRSGFANAVKDKNNEYTIDALSDYNELERSATHVMALIQTKEMKESSSVQIQSVVNRESEDFPSYKMTLDAPTGYFYTNRTPNDNDVASIVENLEI